MNQQQANQRPAPQKTPKGLLANSIDLIAILSAIAFALVGAPMVFHYTHEAASFVLGKIWSMPVEVSQAIWLVFLILIGGAFVAMRVKTSLTMYEIKRSGGMKS